MTWIRKVWTQDLCPPFHKESGEEYLTLAASHAPGLWVTKSSQNHSCSNIRTLQGEKPTLLTKWVLHGKGFCCCYSPGSWEFTMQLSGSCIRSRAREKTDSLTAHKVYHGCCSLLDHGLADWQTGVWVAGLCKAAAPGIHSHGPGPHCARSRRETKQLPSPRAHYLCCSRSNLWRRHFPIETKILRGE